PRASHHAGTDPTTARRNDRRYLSTGAQIRTRHQPRLGWPALRDRPRAQCADYIFLRRTRSGAAAAGDAASTDAARDRPQLRRDPEREAPGGGQPIGPRARRPLTVFEVDYSLAEAGARSSARRPTKDHVR